MFRSFGWVELNINDMVILTEVDWQLIWFGTQVGQVEVSASLADHDFLKEDFIIDEMNVHHDMFDLIHNCVCLKDIDTGLTIFINWQWMDVLFIEAKEVSHIFQVEAFLSTCEDTVSFTVGRVECDTVLWCGLPIEANIVDESNEILVR